MNVEISTECTECGYTGDLEILDEEYRRLPEPDYDSEPETERIWLKEQCPMCCYINTKDDSPPDPYVVYDTKREINL